MREILFRGKRTDNGEWAEGADIMHNTIRGKLCIANVCMDWISVDLETFWRFTGLTDKNDRKIFEGDIIRHKGEFGLVIYSYDYGMFEVNFGYCFADFSDISTSNCEVVGEMMM